MEKSIQIIGSGFSSLSAACYLAKLGHNVSIFEKKSSVGGRATASLGRTRSRVLHCAATALAGRPALISRPVCRLWFGLWQQAKGARVRGGEVFVPSDVADW